MQRRIWIAGAMLLIACAAGSLRWRSKTHADVSRVYKIGYGNDVPYHFPGADGQPAGLAVDMVREAARRHGIRLEWVKAKLQGLSSIQQGEVDLWVLMVIRPERLKQVHLTAPYLVAETCFLAPERAGTKTLADLAHARISLLDFDAMRRSVRSILPAAILVPVQSTADSVTAIQDGRADAAYLDQYAATAALLSGAETHSLRLLSAGGKLNPMGIASSFAARQVADDLRDEMRSVASGDSLRSLIQRWGFFSSRSTDAIAAVEEEKTWNRVLSAGVALLLVVALVVTMLARRLHRERDLAEARGRALEESQEKLNLIAENTGDVIWILDFATERFTYVSPSVVRLRGYTPEEVMSRPHYESLTPESARRIAEQMAARLQAFAAGDESARMQITEGIDQPRKDGSIVTTESVTTLLTGPDGKARELLGVSRDVTWRIQAEEEHRTLERQLQQAQRLESIGRLAGGIAHDFNNLLTVINGYSKILLTHSAPGDPNAKRLEEIHRAGTRAAGLTQQLLAFSRRQVITPKRVDLNASLRETLGMLRHILGEDIHIETGFAAGLGLTLVDPDQMHQVIMNLAVNARDAMPRGGRLLLETSNADVDGQYQERHPDMTPGQYILLAVTDTGEGMDAATRQAIFEPFFTTKERGRGTGLGLSTVHGIVRQSGGWIWVYSEPGHGSTFKIYLPRVEGESADAVEIPAARPEPKSGGETILITEDQGDVRRFAVEVLQGLGYRVREAASAEAALALAAEDSGRIDLLLTDVVLPGMNGPDLARRMCAARPGLKVIYTSGYTEHAVVRQGVMQPGFPYLAKPFSPGALAGKVREALGQM